MSEKYYRDINTNKDIVKFKLQLGAILLKLNENNLNIKNNDNDIKCNYDICVSNKNSLIDVDRKIFALNNNITKINNNISKINSDIEKINKKDIIKHNDSIENIWFFNVDTLNDHSLTKSKPAVILYEYEIESKFTVNSILEISCNILYKYANYNDIGLLRHAYSLLDVNDCLIQTHNITHTNSGDNYTNHLTMNDNFSFLFKNSHTDKLKIKLQVAMLDLNRNDSIGFRILNPYKNNILCVKYLKYLN